MNATPADTGGAGHWPARLLRALARLEQALTFAAFTVMVGAIFLDVAYRELTGVGLQWARQVGVYANVGVVMLGIGIASARGAHLRPRFGDNWLPARWQPAVARAGEAVMAAFCALLAGLGAHVTVESYLLQERSTVIGVEIWPVMAVIPVGFALVALRHGLYALHPALRPSQ